MKSFGRFFGIWALAAALMTANTRPAHAVVGIASANAPTAIVGGVLLGAAIVGPAAVGTLQCLGEMAQSNASYCSSRGFTTGVYGYLLVSPFLAALGFVLLPDTSGGSLQLAPLQVTHQKNLVAEGVLSREHLQAYQDERSELESVAQDVGIALRNRAIVALKKGVKVDDPLLARWGAEEWTKRKDAVSLEAFEAFSNLAALGFSPSGGNP